MVDVCSDCGLPKDLCVCETIAREQQKIEVVIEKRKFGKKYTVIRGLGKGVDMNGIAKLMKSKLACGGTTKNNMIELQGDHMVRVKEVLIDLGFPEETIEIKHK